MYSQNGAVFCQLVRPQIHLRRRTWPLSPQVGERQAGVDCGVPVERWGLVEVDELHEVMGDLGTSVVEAPPVRLPLGARHRQLAALFG